MRIQLIPSPSTLPVGVGVRLGGPGTAECHQGSKSDGYSCVQKNTDQVKLWGLQEGTYLFQLTAADSDQPESTTNVTVTVLSAKQTEGKGGGREAVPRAGPL